MKRFLALLALLSLALALPAAAPAKKKRHKHPHHRTTVLKGSFEAVGADGAYTDKKFGKAQLVDNRKRDKLSVHVRRLAPRTPYTFALYSVAKGQPRCEEGASGGTQETAFPPKTKTTNARGHLNAKQRSKTFKVNRARRYFVLVSDGDAGGRMRQAQGQEEGEAPVQGRPRAPRQAEARSPRQAEARAPRQAEAEQPRARRRARPAASAKGAGAAKRGCKRRGR